MLYRHEEATRVVRVLTQLPARVGFEPTGCQCTPTGIRLVFRIWFSIAATRVMRPEMAGVEPAGFPDGTSALRACSLDRHSPLFFCHMGGTPIPRFAGKDLNLHRQIQSLLTYR